MATSLICKLILSVYITNQYVSAQAVEPRILYGDTVKIEDYPYYAGLNNCGAVILSDIWVMTAAHCVLGVDPLGQNYVWVGGETYANSLKVPYKHIHIHEGYPDPTGLPTDDIALLKLSTPLQLSEKIQPIKLPSGSTSKTNITFVGRGRDEGDSGSPLISDDTVVGLASFIGSVGCKNAKLSFFVNVLSYVPWIKTITGL